MFRIAAPIVWEHGQSVLHLLKLLPTSLITEYESRHFTIRIEGPAIHPKRFNLYAPFVKTLEIYEEPADHYEISGWSNLLALSRHRTLLPNLAELTMTTDCGDCFWDVVLWTRLFASESLVELRCIPTRPRHSPEISLLATSVYLGWVVEHCPRLEVLSLFPSKRLDDIDSGDGEDKLLTLLYEKPYYDYLLPTLEIRKIFCSLLALENESLKALSQLPQLTSIMVYDSFDVPSSQQVQLPENAFPSLTILSVYLSDPMDVGRILTIRPLLTTLVLAKIDIEAHLGVVDASWINNVFLPAFAYATCLERLQVNFDTMVEYVPVELGDISVLYPFRQLPLIQIDLFSVTFEFENTSTSLKDILPHVSILQLTRCHAQLRDLHLFAELPNLERLVLQLRIDTEFDDTNAPNPSLGSRLRTLEGSPGSQLIGENVDINKVARYLISLWPNLHQVNWFGDESAIDWIQALNRELQTVRSQSSGH